MKSLIGGSSWIKFCPLITTLSYAIIANHNDTLQLANSIVELRYMGRSDFIFGIILVFRRVGLPMLHNLGWGLIAILCVNSNYFQKYFPLASSSDQPTLHHQQLRHHRGGKRRKFYLEVYLRIFCCYLNHQAE